MSVIKEKKRAVQSLLKEIGLQILTQMEEGNFPTIEMPSRSTSNICYDEELRQYVLGDKKIRRTARNIRHLRPFTQLVWLAWTAHQLMDQGKTSTLRDIFYMSQAYEVDFKDQPESDDIITDL
ncbi:MAG: DNA topoisomerase IV subunit A, partial [Candidatus Hecatellaceae archaeon]